MSKRNVKKVGSSGLHRVKGLSQNLPNKNYSIGSKPKERTIYGINIGNMLITAMFQNNNRRMDLYGT